MKKTFQGTFSVNLTVTAYDEEEAIDELYERLEQTIKYRELSAEDYVLHEYDIAEVDCD